MNQKRYRIFVSGTQHHDMLHEPLDTIIAWNLSLAWMSWSGVYMYNDKELFFGNIFGKYGRLIFKPIMKETIAFMPHIQNNFLLWIEIMFFYRCLIFHLNQLLQF